MHIHKRQKKILLFQQRIHKRIYSRAESPPDSQLRLITLGMASSSATNASRPHLQQTPVAGYYFVDFAGSGRSTRSHPAPAATAVSPRSTRGLNYPPTTGQSTHETTALPLSPPGYRASKIVPWPSEAPKSAPPSLRRCWTSGRADYNTRRRPGRFLRGTPVGGDSKRTRVSPRTPNGGFKGNGSFECRGLLRFSRCPRRNRKRAGPMEGDFLAGAV